MAGSSLLEANGMPGRPLDTTPVRGRRDRANGEVAQMLACYGLQASPNLGSELYGSTVRRLRDQHLPLDLAPDLFQKRLLSAARWLEENGSSSVRNPRAWMQRIYDSPLPRLRSAAGSGAGARAAAAGARRENRRDA